MLLLIGPRIFLVANPICGRGLDLRIGFRGTAVSVCPNAMAISSFLNTRPVIMALCASTPEFRYCLLCLYWSSVCYWEHNIGVSNNTTR